MHILLKAKTSIVFFAYNLVILKGNRIRFSPKNPVKNKHTLKTDIYDRKKEKVPEYPEKKEAG